MDMKRPWKDLPEWFQQLVLYGDNEVLRIQYGGKFVTVNYK
jgi:hypothetical protein